MRTAVLYAELLENSAYKEPYRRYEDGPLPFDRLQKRQGDLDGWG